MLLVNCSRPGLIQSEGVSALASFLQQKNIPLTTIYVDDLTPEHLRGVPGVILTGSPLYVTQERALVQKCLFLKECPVPIFGICFGHQLIGAIHGATIGEYQETLKGPRKVRFVEQTYPFCYFGQEAVFDQEHKQFLTNVPKGFKLLAKSDVCPVEGMVHETKPIFTTQFHPERYEETLRPLFSEFVKLCLDKNHPRSC